MANSYFQFKQFRIDQSSCAMKVTTDASLFGAWIASQALHHSSALDIGGGTGLLSLMLAQKNESIIDVIEIEPQCFEQMKQNIENSEWHDRIRCMLKDINDYSPKKQYDIVVSNPPFHQGQLKSDQETINLARHGDELTLELLFNKVKSLLSHDGIFFLLVPAYREAACTALAASHGMHLDKKTMVKQSPFHDAFRIMFAFKNSEALETVTDEIIIKDSKDQYSQKFIEYLRDYYLYM